jgi:hypothetical protein
MPKKWHGSAAGSFTECLSIAPRAIQAEVVVKIIYLRKPHHLGPWKIQAYMKSSPRI